MKGKSLIFSLIMGGFCLSASAQKVVFDFNGKVTDSNGQGIAGVVVKPMRKEHGLWYRIRHEASL